MTFETHLWMQRMGLLLLALAVLDALFTDIGLRLTVIEEANPLMRWIYEQHVVYFYSIKIGLPLVLLLLFQSLKPRRIFALLLGPTVCLYLFVLGIHLYWIAQL